MTREKAIQVDHLLYKIECYEALLNEISHMEVLEELKDTYKEANEIEAELLAVVRTRLDSLLKELEEM